LGSDEFAVGLADVLGGDMGVDFQIGLRNFV
jgi:hypothetical protein